MKTALEAALDRHNSKVIPDESILVSETADSQTRFIPTRHNAEGVIQGGFIYISPKNHSPKRHLILHKKG